MAEDNSEGPNDGVPPIGRRTSRQEWINETHAYWRTTAGDAYVGLVHSKDASISLMNDANPAVRITAISVCDLHWKCSGDQNFRATCQRLAMNDPDERVRNVAIDSLGAAYRDTKDPDVSHLLADTVLRADLSKDLRLVAYWALREVQLGVTSEDLVKKGIHFAKLLHERPGDGGVPAQVKHTLLRNGRLPESVWDSAGEIDFDFVKRVRRSIRESSGKENGQV